LRRALRLNSQVMPELPEAETIARALAAALAGKSVAGIRLRRRDFLKTGSASRLRRLVGQRLDTVSRRGKCVLMHFGARRLLLQLGMSGRAYLHRAGQRLPAHTHLVVSFRGGLQLRYANVRRIAAGVHVLAPGQPGPLAELGPDADAIGRDQFVRRLSGRSSPIKAALMNQSILAGVGNIYSDEALFRAGIRPTRRASRISRRRLLRLHSAVRQVLRDAVAAGGSSLGDATPFASADGGVGYFTMSHRVYGRYGQPCFRCGRKLRRTILGGRSSSYCPNCQK